MVKLYDLILDTEKHPVLAEKHLYETDQILLNSPQLITDFVNKSVELFRKAEEYLYMIAFDNALQVQGVFEIGHGIVNGCMVGEREIFIRALLCGATYIVVIHNHPSGILKPSTEDKQCCNKIKKTGDILGIKLIDFLIINKDYFSFKEADMI